MMDGWMCKEELSSHIPALATCWGKCFCTAISWLGLLQWVYPQAILRWIRIPEDSRGCSNPKGACRWRRCSNIKDLSSARITPVACYHCQQKTNVEESNILHMHCIENADLACSSAATHMRRSLQAQLAVAGFVDL